MSLFSSLYTGVNGMNAQSQHTATISTNIANSTTVGYKKVDTVFHDLVVTKTSPAKFAHGGVFTDTIHRNDIQGALQQTAISTEIGISGGGFFAVKSNADADLDFLFTRNGTFSPDSEGIMRNAAGFVLYGWPIDELGNVAGGTTLDSLQPVDVDELNEIHRQTTAAEFSVNLDASEPATNPDLLFPQQSLPVNGVSASDFTRNFTVVDGDGVPRDLIFEFRKVPGPMATAATGTSALDYTMSLTDGSIFGGINAGDTFSVTVGAATQEYIIGAAAGPGQIRVDTIGELSNEINANFGGGDVLDMSLDADGRLVFQAVDPTANMSFAEIIGSPLSGGGSLEMVTQFGNPPLNYTPQTSILGGDYPDQANFPAIANQTDPSTRGWWEVTILTADPDLTDPTLAPVAISSGLMSFNSDGTLNATPNGNGNIELFLNNINFDDDSTTDTTSLTVDLSGFSQFAGAYNVIVQNHNGAEAGTLSGIQIGRDGRVIASFTNSEQFEIYQIPLATFVNPNGLESITGTVFAQTSEAGDLTMVEAGTGGAGVLNGATIENSNVDLADEFANLIVSQRAFQANSRVVNTVDEMTQQLRTLKS
ncbi:MAG: flagellar hook-basal body complex protein [Rhodospirillales bacterium]|nr:flagellar hook-basal body complex protein [Rhodospirillales bacterium]